MRCQCPDPSEDHAANECENPAVYHVRIITTGVELHVCWDCIRSIHERIEP